MAVPRSRIAGTIFANVIFVVVLGVQVFSGPTLIRSGLTGILFLTAWSLGGVLLAVIPLRPADGARRVAALAWVSATAALLLGLALTLSDAPMGEGSAALAAALLLATVAVRPRRPDPEALAAAVAPAAEREPHLWS